MAPEHQTYLGFSWKINGRKKVFCLYSFTLWSFNSPYAFYKNFGPLVSTWHKQGTKRAVYIDDEAWIDSDDNSEKQASLMTRSQVLDTGWVVNEEKLQWEPRRGMTWLGVNLDLIQNTYSIPQEHVASFSLRSNHF